MDIRLAEMADSVEEPVKEREGAMEKLWVQLRKLLVFQLKLYIDALRDLLLSALSLAAFIIDFLLRLEGPTSCFERVLEFGRLTERSINLFNHFDPEQQAGRSVDNILNEVEEKIRENVRDSKK